ncbi:hypothetical protein ACFW04_011991 [Cataglyphis niger]
MILDYSTCNRKCKKCDNDGHVPDHDCYRNFYDSAKESEILKSQNVEVGILIGSDDSFTISTCRSASNHPILKQQIKIVQEELTKESIVYFHKCFTYAIAQNIGNSIVMAAAISYGYIKDKKNYDHRTMPGGFNNQNLFKDLKEIFYKLADNAARFVCGVSSNRNKSLNTISKANKSCCYSMSAFADFRFSCCPKKLWGKIYSRNSRKNSAIIRKAPFTPYHQDKQNLFIVTKFGKKDFDIYINLTQKISISATVIQLSWRSYVLRIQSVISFNENGNIFALLIFKNDKKIIVFLAKKKN